MYRVVGGRTMPIIAIPKPLREKLGEEATASLIEVMNAHGRENKESIIDLAEQRFETRVVKSETGIREDMTRMEAGIREDMMKMEAGIREDMTKMESSLREEIVNVRKDVAAVEGRFNEKLSGEISNLREEMIRSDLSLKDELKEEIHKHGIANIKWMFVFWIGQIGVILGILFAVFK